MDFTQMAVDFTHFIGFRYALMILCGLGLLMLVWLMASLPGKRQFRLLVQIFCLLGLAVLVVLLPLRLRFIWPLMLMWAMGIIGAITLMLVLLQFVRLVALIPAAILGVVWRGPLRVMVSRWATLLVLLGGIGLGGYSFWNCVQVPEVMEVSVQIRDLPPEFEGFHIVQLSDTHLGGIFNVKWISGVVARVNSLNPDIVAVTGDVGEFSPAVIGNVLVPLQDLHGTEGVFFSLGNHENYQGLQSWANFYNTVGTLLRNSSILITRGDAVLALGGIDDLSPDPALAFAGTPTNAVRVLLGHRPQYAALAAASDVDLMLAGHTHGGMAPIIRNVMAKANRGFVSGMYLVDRMWLYVSNGTGLWSYIPMRLGTASEITSLRLTRAMPGAIQ